MTDTLVTAGMAVFGLTAMWWAMGNSPRLRRWAPVVGLVGQLWWLAFAWSAHRKGVDVRGLLVLCAAWSVVYVRGIVVQWKAPASQEQGPDLVALRVVEMDEVQR